MGRREDNKARKLAALEQAATRLFMEVGYHRASIEQIVGEAGIARGTFYLYFPDKAAIFKHLTNKLLDPAMAALERAREALEHAHTLPETQSVYLNMSRALTEALLENGEAALLYYREQRDPGEIGEWLRVRSRQFDAVVTDLVRSLMDRRMLRSADPKVVAMAIIGAIHHIAFAFLSGEPFDDPEVVGTTLVQLFGQGLVLPDAEG